MILGIGTDVCGIARFEAMLARRPGIAARLLTADECALPVASQAARFAAKEALAKALGSPGGLRWLDAEVVRGEHGRPHFELRGTVADLLARTGGTDVHLSLSHDADLATAFVVVERREGVPA